MKPIAKWICSPVNEEGAAVDFRYTLKPKQAVKKAVIAVSSIGNYALFFNGTRVGKGVLTPGWTHKSRVQYQTYDVTAMLTEKTDITVGVGPGWAVGTIGHDHSKHYVDDRVSAWAQLELTYSDGSTEVICTDENWDVYSSQVLFSDIYNGETVDKTAVPVSHGKAVIRELPVKIVPQEGEWITEQERLAPVEVIRTPKGELVLDFGQNMTGYVEVTAKAPRGSRMVLHHGEVLDKDGNFYNANYRKAKNEVTYIFDGETDTFKPLYSFQGFRYVHLVEYPFDTVDVNAFRAVAVNSEMKRTGRYNCGNEKINQLYHNIIWGQKSNYLDVPTDCPQRDERLGWTGDAQVFCRTAAINYDVERFFKKWLSDIRLEQEPNGAIPRIIPNCMGGGVGQIACGWSDAACIIPWQIYLAYGEQALLKKNYSLMQGWVHYLRQAGPEEYLWLKGSHYGDWLATDGDADQCLGATPEDYIACIYYAYSTQLLVKAGKVLGKDMTEYEELYRKVVQATRDRYIRGASVRLLPNGWKEGDAEPTLETQTAYVLALYFGICEEEHRPAMAARLAQIIRDNGTRMTTGFLGTPYLLHVLSQNGYTDLAYELLMQERAPSWLYPVNHGATTMWEHWNSLKEDGSFWSTGMNSFNHYAYGAVYDWLFNVSSGISPTETAPGYKEITLEPHPNKCLGFADASIESRNGFIRSHWYYKGDTVYYEFEIPQGVTAHLRLPSGYTAELNGGIYHFAE